MILRSAVRLRLARDDTFRYDCNQYSGHNCMFAATMEFSNTILLKGLRIIAHCIIMCIYVWLNTKLFLYCIILRSIVNILCYAILYYYIY